MIEPIANPNRNVWCLLGLPFDAVTMDQTLDKIYHAVDTREKCFISTPNLNFLITSQKDNEFRNSVINSDLSVADGKPLIWMARLLNIPLPERVAGSDIIENLIENRQDHKPIKVFFFGGQDGIAELACQKLNTDNSGLHCVGFHNPGFGSIEEMSSPDIINTINESGADFVIVSLGAKKGQAWIEKNNRVLDAPVISHLGAVVNFIAGTVVRSPKAMQRFGLEWIWRIKEEPMLWKRYMHDGASLVLIFLFKLIPSFFIQRRNKSIKNNLDLSDVIKTNESVVLKLTGTMFKDDILSFDNLVQSLTPFKLITMNIVDVSFIDSPFLAYIQQLKFRLNKKSIEVKIITSPNIKSIFGYNNCDYLLG